MLIFYLFLTLINIKCLFFIMYKIILIKLLRSMCQTFLIGYLIYRILQHLLYRIEAVSATVYISVEED